MRHVAILSQFNLPLLIALARGMSSVGRQRDGWNVEIVPSALEPAAVDRLRVMPIDGLVVLPRTEAEVAVVAKLDLPIVNTLYHTVFAEASADPESSGEAVLPSVLPDEEAVGRAAARHLLDRGYKRFGCLSTRWRVGRLRQVGFVAEIEQADADCVTLGDARFPSAEGVLPELVTQEHAVSVLHRVPSPVGMFVVDDRAAIVTLSAAASIGLRVPDDVAVVGVNNDELLAEFARTPLSSVDLDVEQVGRVAAKLLDALMNGRDVDTVAGGRGNVWTVPPKEVVGRQSTQMLAVQDEAVREALTHMRRHACRGMTVGQLCKSIAVSRRSLERKMVRSLGRTPAEEIRRIRIEAARTLLRRQDIVLADVAQAVGYASQSSFTNAFVQVCGMTPGRWRRERLAEAS
jgi:LacI family transcriptional regulator